MTSSAEPLLDPHVAKIDSGSQTPDSIAQGFDRFRIVKQLGVGPHGVAHLAIDRSTGAEVELRDIRRLLSVGDAADRLARLRICRLIDDPGVVSIVAMQLDGERPCVALELLRGTPLAELITAGRSFELGRALGLAAQLAAAVAEVHRLGLSHGGLRPAEVRIVDLDHISIDATALDTNAAAHAGFGPDDLSITALRYRVPEEQSPDRAEATADVYCLAQLVCDLIGMTPHSKAPGRTNTETLLRDALQAYLPAEEGAEPLIALLHRARSADPELRPLAVELAQALRQTAGDCLAAEGRLPGDDASAGSGARVPLSHFPDETREELFQPVQPALDVTGDAPAGLNRRFIRVKQIAPGDLLGRYQVISKLGEGGMGAVYKAVDRGSQEVVAVKVLAPAVAANPNAMGRFLKEARLLASINNPFVTNLIEVNEDEGLRYIAMEFVDGVDLKSVLAEHGALDERQALTIIADVAKALVDAHERGIVHRDIKPANILLGRDESLPLADAGREAAAMLSRPRIKLSDFGLARHVDQSESLALTQAGSMLGTPLYMAPEQCTASGKITPQTDVYALGVTLFELLAGRPPFRGDDPMKLAAMHCFEPHPALNKLNPELSQGVVQVVDKALAKRPEGRYASAGHLLADVERLLLGEPSRISVHPILPAHDESLLSQADFTWDLAASPEQLWPYVSNTERINRAAGLPAVVYQTRHDPERGARKFGSFRLAGMNIAWEEHPFEWIEGQRMGILREFSRGPFAWFLSTVELESLPQGGTRLRHSVKIQPRGWVGRLVAAIEVKLKGRRSLDRIYRHIDAALGSQTRGPTLDAFEPAAELPKPRRMRLEQRLKTLAASGIEPGLVERLGNYLEHAPAQELARIRPIALAKQLEHDVDAVIHACFLAASQGLLLLRWDLLCPTCRVAADVKDTLKAIEQHGRCEACNLDFELDFAKSVELLFRAHPEIRDVDLGTYCIGGPEHAPHVVAQLRVGSQERMELELNLPVGEYLLRGPQLPQAVHLLVRASGAPSHADVHLSSDSDPRRSCVLRGGKQVLSITNGYSRELIVRLERTTPRGDVLTAAHASSLADFRELFPDQVLKSGNLMTVETVTLLTTAVDDVDALYAKVGDAQAYAQIQEHFQQLDEHVRRHGGTIVKFVGEGLTAVFQDTGAALRAALSAQHLMESHGPTSALRLRVGLHRGASLVTTLNGRLDYFGATARLATTLLTLARSGELVVTEAVTSDPLVGSLWCQTGLTSSAENLPLPGGAGHFAQRVRLPSSRV